MNSNIYRMVHFCSHIPAHPVAAPHTKICPETGTIRDKKPILAASFAARFYAKLPGEPARTAGGKFTL
jgi:hypothetical protein